MPTSLSNPLLSNKKIRILSLRRDPENYAEFLELLLHKKISNPEVISYLD